MEAMTQPRIRDLKSEKELESLAEGDVVLMEVGNEVRKARYDGVQRYKDDLEFINFINLFCQMDCEEYGHKEYEDRLVFHIRMGKKEIKQIKAEHISLSKENHLITSLSSSGFTFYEGGLFGEFYSFFDKQLSEVGI